MAIPTDATHRNAGGDLFKPSKVHPGLWRQWSDTHWQPSSDVNETLYPLVLVPHLPCAPAPAVPPPVPSLPCAPDQLTEAKRLLLELFKANDGCADVENCDPAVSQWLGSPMRTEIETFLGLKPVDPVEAQLQRDEFMYGSSYALRNADGTVTRLDPTLIIIRQGKV